MRWVQWSGENEGEVFLGRSVTTHKNVSGSDDAEVDAEIRRIIDEQYGLRKVAPKKTVTRSKR